MKFTEKRRTMRCRITQWLISSAHDQGQSPAGFALRHMEKCPSCRKFQTDIVRLHMRLQQTPLPSAAAQFIIHSQSQPVRAIPVYRRPILIAAAAAAVILAVIMFAAVFQMPKARPNENIAVNHAVSEISGLDLSLNPWLSVDISTTKLQNLATATMEREINNIAQDTSAASAVLICYFPCDIEQADNR